MKIMNVLNELIDKKPDKKILVMNEKVYTYKDIKLQINKWKIIFKHREISENDKVIIYIKNPIEFVGAYIALCDLNCVIIPVDISSNLKTMSNIIQSSKANAIISSEILPFHSFIKARSKISGHLLYLTIYEREIIKGNIMEMFYTSGTTGLPKCVMFSKQSINNNVLNMMKILNLSEKDVIYTPISLVLPATLNTVLLPALLSGTKIFASDSSIPSRVLQNIVEQNITVFFAVPFYYKLLVSNRLCKEEYWKNVRLCLTSSAYLSEEGFTEFYEKTNKMLHSIYCSSEAGTIAYNDANDINTLKRYVGRPLDGCEVSLLDVNNDGIGEIIVRGNMTSSKYYLNDELNEKVFYDDWVRTGDIGSINEDGYLELKGRISDTINIAGHLVNPLEIEQIVMKNAAVKDALVYRYMNNVGNEMLGIKIVRKKNISLNEKEVIQYCEKAFPNYKVPKKVIFVDDIETGRYGKKKRFD